MESELKQAGTMKFFGMSFRIFENGGRMWLPLMDIARGLGYSRADKV